MTRFSCLLLSQVAWTLVLSSSCSGSEDPTPARAGSGGNAAVAGGSSGRGGAGRPAGGTGGDSGDTGGAAGSGGSGATGGGGGGSGSGGLDGDGADGPARDAGVADRATEDAPRDSAPPRDGGGAPGVTLTPVDGGPTYYGGFTNALPADPSYFPIGVWLQPVETQAQIDNDKDFGLNLYVGVACPECTNEALLRSNAMNAIIQANERTRFNDIGGETAGWLLHDEIDMCCGPPGFSGGNGYNMLSNVLAGLPQDGRFRYNNYGKGVMLWETDSDAARFVNDYQQVVSNDLYWFTDPNERSQPRYRVASSYGLTVDRMRSLDAMDGKRMPIWNFVELGWPFTESAAQGGRAIEPAELRAAVWHSIIAGARGILYFDHNFGGPCGGSVFRGGCYPNTRSMARSVNQQIKALAPVLNAPTVTSGASSSSSIRTMVKWWSGNFYVFAGSKNNAASTGSVSIRCIGNASAVRLGEAGTVAVSDGSFSDTFADGNAIHIYRIDGGSSCGLYP